MRHVEPASRYGRGREAAWLLAVLALGHGCACGETTPTECADGADNDGDGLADCADPGCSASCPATDAGPPPLCGNGAVNAGEECDLDDLGGATCAALGYEGGALSCGADCRLDRAGCSTCGDGVAQGDEACDTADLREGSCATAGYTSGVLQCAADCTLDTDRCALCGDGVAELNEWCDDGNAGELDGCTSECELTCFPTAWSRAAATWVMDTGPPGAWDAAGVVPGSVLRRPGGGYRMWYAGSDGAVWRIGVADSPDGIAWSRVALVLEPDEPGRFDDTNVLDPSVLYDGTMYYLWYTGEDGEAGRIGFATSADGLDWVRQGSLLCCVGGGGVDHAREPSVLFGAPQFWLWFAGDPNSALNPPRASADGLSFLFSETLPPTAMSSYSSCPDVRVIASPSAVRIGTEGWGAAMAGHCNPMNWGCVPIWRISAYGFVSPDYFEATLLDVGPAGAWDGAGVAYPVLLPDAESWRLWYGGYDGTTWRIGLATGSCP